MAKKYVPQYFRVKMTPSWANKLRDVFLPAEWTRVTGVFKDAKTCVVIIKVEESKPVRPSSVTHHLLANLEYDGYMLVELISEQDAQKILEAK